MLHETSCYYTCITQFCALKLGSSALISVQEQETVGDCVWQPLTTRGPAQRPGRLHQVRLPVSELSKSRLFFHSRMVHSRGCWNNFPAVCFSSARSSRRDTKPPSSRTPTPPVRRRLVSVQPSCLRLCFSQIAAPN